MQVCVPNKSTELSSTRFFFKAATSTEKYTLSLHDALPISSRSPGRRRNWPGPGASSPAAPRSRRSEEHTSELQSRRELVCRLLLEKKIDNMYSSFTNYKAI